MEPFKVLKKKQESSVRKVQERTKNFFGTINVQNESEVSMNSLTTFRNKADPNVDSSSLSPFENRLLHVKSNLRPVYKGDDLNSVTSSDFSSRSDLENMNSLKEFSITNSKESQAESKSTLIQSDQMINKRDSSNLKKNPDNTYLNESIESKESNIESKTEDDMDVIKIELNFGTLHL